MARPIRNTPIITGKDATAFIQAASTIPSETIRRIERIRLEKGKGMSYDMPSLVNIMAL